MKQTIQVMSYPDGDDDCYRESYYAMKDGQRVELTWCRLPGSEYTAEEIRQAVAKHFGPDCEIEMV